MEQVAGKMQQCPMDGIGARRVRCKGKSVGVIVVMSVRWAVKENVDWARVDVIDRKDFYGPGSY